MKILAIHSVQNIETENESAIDIWRVWRPLEELKKHVDWQIDYQPTVIKDLQELASASDLDVEKLGKQLGAYDIIFTSYFTDPTVFAFLHTIQQRYGTKLVLDVDDDIFNIEEDSLFWARATRQDAFMMQRMLRLAKNICTTTPVLADRFKKESEVDANIAVIPNYISEAYRSDAKHEEGIVTIGFFGGASHYYDLHETGVLPAIKKIMFKYKNVRFTSVGVPIDYYLPRARTTFIESVSGRKWTDELFPTLNFDISIAPVRPTKFAEGKSNIKWLESTKMGAAFVASKVGPYKELSNDTATCVVNNEVTWYIALEKLVNDAGERARLVANSQAELAAKWRLEDNWVAYKKMFEEVHANG